ncbi:FUSC family protein [Streptomyces lavenduligriseus]|uniref:FUSC family protein n=1 Tax=Streptomyces lavenduligriseus TaxID=67315 RepID=A0ABT0NTR9_9ACTN|nr:FUSC family protein [Streptomyces lavenduligriseus]MCL3994857.1 FUSC family protein [Streptomyces lavenduligriseus]
MSSATPHRLPLAGALRLGRPSDIWFKPALSAVVSVAPPNLTLLALGRLDLAMYTMAGSLCALYGHNRPYAARARTLAWVVLGMVGGLAVALLASALTTNAVILVTVGAVLAAVQKTVCDATRVGPPGNVVLTFISSASLFVPQTPGRLPGHIGLALAAGAWAWLVCMAPGLLRPHGPERRATAQALNAAAAYAGTRGTGHGHAGARAACAAAIHAAWQSLLAAGARPDSTRRALEHLLVRAEVALAAPADTDPERLRSWALALRGTGRVPRVVASGGDADELLGVAAEQPLPPRSLRHRLAPLAPLAVRTALGCALAGYAALALGVGRPYWALVTAASLYQVNVTLTWSRAVQRVVGNLVGVLVFAALAPLTHLHPAALVLVSLALNFGAEALIGRNYWLGSVCVTPMALLITEFARSQDTADLITDRIVDTLIGALVGFAAAVAVTNRRAGARLDHALTAAERAREHAARLLAEPHPQPRALESARRTLAAALVDLRATADAAAGEWWQRALPEDRVVLTEQAGHRTLAATVRRQGLVPQDRDEDPGRAPGGDRDPDRTTEDTRP